MPRKLPWMQNRESIPLSGSSRASPATRPAKKRVKPSKPESDEEEEVSVPTKNKTPRGRGRTASTSPPPEPPTESFMNEGLDQDDKYRMVEDEFFSIARHFTIHLHAAEYKRQQKLVKVRNAEAISSISRPVTGIMPDHTKRKVESVARSKAQRTVLQSLLGKKRAEEHSSDDSDGDGLPYVGTTLHGLMDSPKGKSASLSMLRNTKVATRAAAGFHTSDRVSSKSSPSESPKPKSASRFIPPKAEHDGSTESSDEDDDLDARIAPPKFTSSSRNPKLLQSTSIPCSTPSAAQNMHSLLSSRVTKKLSSEKDTANATSIQSEPSSVEALRTQSESRARIARRLENARLQRVKQEDEEKNKKKAMIPTFL